MIPVPSGDRFVNVVTPEEPPVIGTGAWRALLAVLIDSAERNGAGLGASTCRASSAGRHITTQGASHP